MFNNFIVHPVFSREFATLWESFFVRRSVRDDRVEKCENADVEVVSGWGRRLYAPAYPIL